MIPIFYASSSSYATDKILLIRFEFTHIKTEDKWLQHGQTILQIELCGNFINVLKFT